MHRSKFVATAVSFAIALFSTVGWLDAQGNGGSDAVFSDVIDVRVVNVEVVVVDKQGEPVTGLTRDDFEVFEDGEPVDVVNFYAVEGSTARLGAGQVAGEASETPEPPSGTTQRLDLVIFVDNLHIRPQNRKLLFENLRQRLSEAAVPGSRMMLVTMNNRIEVVEPFTSDPERILAALGSIEKQTSLSALVDSDRRMFMSQLGRASTQGRTCPNRRGSTSGGGGGGGSTGGGGGGGGGVSSSSNFDFTIQEAHSLALSVRSIAERRYQIGRSTIRSLAAFADTLGGLPGRKAVLYLSDGIPARPGDSVSEAWIAKYDLWFQQNEPAIRNCSRFPDTIPDLQRALTASGSNNFDLSSDLELLTNKASDNRVTFYPISNGGRANSFVSAANPGSADGNSAQVMRSAMIAESMSRDASMLQLADDTGGRVFTGNANIGELINRASKDFSSFYSLGYEPPERELDNKFHKIRIKVRREGAKARHIKGYQDKHWRDRLGDMTVAAALYDLEANPLGIQLQPGEMAQQGGGRFKVPVMVQIPFQNVALMDDGEKADAKLSLLVVVRNDQGGFSDPRRFDLPISIPSARVAEARGQAAGYPLELELKKGDQRVAVGIRDHIGQTSSVLKLDFDTGSSDKSKKSKKKRKKKKRARG
ncbi:MAG: VWA domain-containing protein [Acidobacteriota bacterium]